MMDNLSCPIASIEAVQNDLMDNMYIANVLNRIRELQSPSPVDRTRWLWELLQNAQDSINPNELVNAKVTVFNDNDVTFEHTGGVFTGKAMCGLLYKYSEGKGNEESTGRFGTGFMTTLTLSEIIEVETNIYEDPDNTRISGFFVILYRNGTEKEELKRGLTEMRKSFKKVEPFKDFTTRFKYRNSNESAIKYGYDSFLNCGAQTMLFATKVQNFSFDYFEKKSSIQRGISEKINDTLSIQSFTVNDDTIKYERKFVIVSIKEINDIISKKYKKERHLRLQIAIEYTGNQLISHENKTCLYCTFPFIGSENHQLPFIMNCPDFEPDTERQSLLLEGDDYINKRDITIINSPLINKIILKRSLDLFKELLNYLIDHQFQSFHVLTNGLINFSNIKNMNQAWYLDNVIIPMRKILEESPIVKTIDNKMTLLKDAYFPIYKKEFDEKQRRMYHNLVSFKYPNQTVTFEESENWEERTWEGLHRIEIEYLVIEEEKLGQEQLNKNININEEEWEYLNILIEYTQEYEPNLLKSHSIVPDMNEKRHDLTETLYDSKDINEDMLNILESIKHPWKTEHVHNKIIKIKTPKHNMNHAIDSCIEKIGNNLELSYIVSKYLPKENARRRSIFEFINEILEHHIDEYQLQYDIDEKLWKKSDENIINELLTKIEQYSRDEVKTRFNLCHRFVSFLNTQEIEKKYLNERNIVPNENYDLCQLNNLRDKSDIPEEFKKIAKEYFKIDINADELNSAITELECKEKSTVRYYHQRINDEFNNLTNNKKKAAILLTHILPKNQELSSYKTQIKLLNLLEPFKDNSQPMNIITIDYGEEILWMKSNEYVKEKIVKENIIKFELLRDLTSNLNFKDDDDTIKYLNQCYKFVTDGKIMPNQYGTLCSIRDLEDGKDVDDIILDLHKYLDHKNNDFRLKLSDKRIEYTDLKRFNMVDCYKDAEAKLKVALKDKIKSKDPKFKEILKKMNKFEDNNCLSFFNQDDDKSNAHRNLIYRIYASNIKNFLRELDDNNADNMNKRRWGFELIQNARDTVINIPGRKVSIEIIYVPHKYVIFRHNGDDFTADSLIGLLFKTSEGKEYNQNTIGRFGTGFMSTHILNRKIELTGNLYIEDKKRNGFYVLIDRTGKGSRELIEHAEIMTQSFKSFENPNDFTEFKYMIENDRVDEIVRMGLESIDQDIPVTLISCPEIEYVKVINDQSEKIYTYNSDANKDSSIKKVDDGSESGRCFLISSINDSNQILSQFKEKESKLSIIASLEIKDQSINNFENDSVFCSYPLIGSKDKLNFPIIINSPNFEPNTERNTLLLNKPDGNKVTASSVNKEILHLCIELSKNIVGQCVQLQLNQLFLLTKGLLLNNFKSPNESFDEDWYKNDFINNMHKVLEESPIVKTIDNKMTLLKDAYFPIYKKEFDEKQRRMYHNLVSFKYPNQTVTFEESENWEERTWEGLHRIEIEYLVIEEEKLGQEQADKNININEEEWEYLNILIEYTQEYEPNLLKSHSIVPDMNEKRHDLTETLYDSKDINEDMLNILESIKHPWKTEHVHNKIIKIKTPKHNMNHAIDSCIEKIGNDLELSYIVSKYLPKENARRRSIFEFINEILEHHIDEYQLQYDIDEKLWKKSDENIINELLTKIEQYSRDDVKTRFNLCHRFVSFLNTQEIEKKYLNERNIVPNENYDLCQLKTLRDKSDIPEQFKNGILTYFKIDINKDELNHQITDINCSGKSEISIYQKRIDDKIQKIDKRVEASVFLLHFRPKEEEKDVYEKIDNIQYCYQSFLSNDEAKYISENKLTISINEVIPTNVSSSVLWNNAIIIVFEEILKKINAFTQFDKFLDFFHFEEEKAISLLNKCYIYEPNIKIPLLNGQMIECESKIIYKSDNIEKKFIDFITAVDENDSIKSELAWNGITHQKLGYYNSSQIIAKIQIATRRVCDNKELRDDPHIKELIAEINMNSIDNILNYNKLDEVEKEKLLIFSKLFVSSLGPRLRELEEPSENIKKRWGWELIQNAKDTIAFEKDKKVNVKFTYDKNHLIFQHDGNDFTLKQYLAMLYKFSEDKHEQKGSTGKFGTGFVTTHIISTKVILRGNLKKENELKGFKVTLDRSGHSEIDLEASMKRTEESKEIFDKPFDYTSFEYKYNDEENVNRVKKGIENITKNLPLVLIFCPKINSVIIENLEKNEKIEYSLQPKTEENIFEVKIVKNENETNIRRFIYFSTEKESKYVSKWYNIPNRKIEVNIVLEIDSENKIKSHIDSESLYCVFPLIGSKIKLPFIINSPDFETSTERDSIYLKASDKDKNTVDNINYEILGIGLELYRNIIDFCTRNHVSSLYYLAEGLNKNTVREEHFCPKTFSESFLTKAREILCSYPVFKISNGEYKTFDNVKLIDYKYPTNEKTDSKQIEKYRKDFYSLFKSIYNNPIDFEESKHWNSFLWTSLSAVKHLDLLKFISDYKTISNLHLIDGTPKFEFINNTIDFVLEFDKVQLSEIEIIPNQNSQFCKGDSNLYFAHDVIEEAVELIHRLGGEWRKKHVHREIKNKNYLSPHTIENAQSIIKFQINMNIEENSIIMMEYIIPDDNDRIKMHDYSHSILGIPQKAIELPKYSSDIWSNCDKHIINLFIQKIEKLGRIRSPVVSVSWLNDLISFLLDKKGLRKSELLEHSIFPNQNNYFMKFTDIYKDEIKYDEIKNAIQTYCSFDVRNELLHSDFNIDLGFTTKYLKEYYIIEQFFTNNRIIYCYEYIKDTNKYEFSKILLKYICSDEKMIEQKQKDLLQSFNVLYNSNIDEIELKSSMNNTTFKYVSNCFAYHINNMLNGKTINELQTKTGKEISEIIESLNIIYSFSVNDAYVPNQKKNFCLFSKLMQLSNETDLPSIIEFQVSMSNLIKPENSLVNFLVMDGIKCPLIKESLDLQRACTNIDNLIYENYRSIIQSKDNDLKDILNNLIKYITVNNYWDHFPHLKQLKDTLISNFIVSENDRDMILAINKMPNKNRSKIINLIKELTDIDISEDDPQAFLKMKKMPIQFRGKIMNLIEKLSDDNVSEDDLISTIEQIFGINVRRNQSNITINNNYYNSYTCNKYVYNHYDHCSAYFIYDHYRTPYISSGSSYYAGNKIPSSNRPYLSDNRIIGYTGEAYAYEKLKNAGFEVTWLNMSDKIESFKIVYNGTTYYIKESYEHYDLVAKKDGHVFYYEVKSTIYSSGNNLFISPSQFNFMSTYKPGATKRVMFVFNVRSNPYDIQFEHVPDLYMLTYAGKL